MDGQRYAVQTEPVDWQLVESCQVLHYQDTRTEQGGVSRPGAVRGDNAVANGLQRSGRIITSAAVLVMIAFLGFGLGDNLGIKEMGVALTIAVLVDVTLVRTLLVPATMTLLGNANWWAPPWMRRVHDRFGLREAPSTHAAADGREDDRSRAVAARIGVRRQEGRFRESSTARS